MLTRLRLPRLSRLTGILGVLTSLCAVQGGDSPPPQCPPPVPRLSPPRPPAPSHRASPTQAAPAHPGQLGAWTGDTDRAPARLSPARRSWRLHGGEVSSTLHFNEAWGERQRPPPDLGAPHTHLRVPTHAGRCSPGFPALRTDRYTPERDSGRPGRRALPETEAPLLPHEPARVPPPQPGVASCWRLLPVGHLAWGKHT